MSNRKLTAVESHIWEHDAEFDSVESIVMHSSSRILADVRFKNADDHHEAVRTAKNLAAAPELLEALDKVIACADFADDEDSGFVIRKNDATYQSILELLAKAETP